MPPKTCKVSKTFPAIEKGCIARRFGTLKYDKQARRKYKKKETANQHFVYAADSPNRPRQHWVKMLYDTGATSTTINQQAATKLGYDAGTVQNLGYPTSIRGVTGNLPAMILYIQFYVRLSDDGEPEDWRQVGGDATISNTRINLLGVTHISQLQSSYKVKFV
jgi:hypothetical protein